ncbi:MAG: DUF3298 and DUF4163 domain-containing protein [Duncaniella sp.]|nr:DUF3298 and DUF4163 domain-containing protein [Muribaculum sp.]MCM1254968.1 DUF3298 and DUF4163 domain-containing protein [Duncaniella sp.]
MKKLMNYLPVAVISLVLASGCVNRDAASTGGEDVITNFDVREVVKSGEKIFKLITDYDTVYLDLYTSVHWPERFGSADLTQLKDSLVCFAYGDSAKLPIEGAMRKFLNDVSVIGDVKNSEPVDTIPDSYDRAQAYFGNVNASIMELDDEMVTYQVTTSTFLGGAHPMTGIRPFTYDLRTGQVLNVKNMFKPEYQDSIMPVIINALARQLDADPMNLDAAGIFSSQLTYPGKPYIANNMLYFHYNPYDIAPYSAGMIDVAVFPYEVAKMLKPEVRELFDTVY